MTPPTIAAEAMPASQPRGTDPGGRAGNAGTAPPAAETPKAAEPPKPPRDGKPREPELMPRVPDDPGPARREDEDERFQIY